MLSDVPRFLPIAPVCLRRLVLWVRWTGLTKNPMRLKNILIAGLGVLLLSLKGFAHVEPELMPLEAIEVGMAGTWHTVVQGIQVEPYELEIIGIMPNGLGPGRPSILARALDSDNRLSGPVAGMSGSPVYIEGKLIGAYSYGYLWPKDQAIIGITPIEQMLEILDRYPLEPPAADSTRLPVRWADAKERLGRGKQPSGNEADALFRPLPTPLAFSGFSPEVVAAFRESWAEAGFESLQGASGGTAEDLDVSLAPGSPVAAVLMNGDFSAAATGTVTWSDGERILGFGHAFQQWGGVELPMAGAEILTIVRNVQLSFKLARVGPVIGSIYQDRLTGVAGKVGPAPVMVPFSIRSIGPGGDERHYTGEMVPHRRILPMLAAMATYQSATRVMESGEEQTIRLSGTIDVEGLEPITFDDVATGSFAIFDLSDRMRSQMQRLLENSKASVTVTGIDLKMETIDALAVNRLREVRLLQERVRARNGWIDLAVTLERFRGEVRTEHIRIHLPDTAAPDDRYALVVADADRADQLAGHLSSLTESPEDIADQWRRRRPSDAAYILLLAPAGGLQVADTRLESLPPSVASQMHTRTSHYAFEAVSERIVAETIIPTPGPFIGSFRLSITIE